MDSDTIIVLSAKLAGTALFVYGLVVFVDQGVGELIKRGVAYVVSPYIWDSNLAWPYSGFVAFQGLFMALIGFFVLRFKSRESDFSSEISYAWPFLRAFFDALILFFALCLTWEFLLSIFEPSTMHLQVIQYLDGTGISNTFVMNFSAIMLALLSAFKLRRFLFGWLPPWATSRRFTLGFGLLSLSLGAVIFVIAFYFAYSFNIFDALAQSRYVYCNEACSFMGTLDLVVGIVGGILVVVGVIVSMERLFPREPALW